MAKEILLTQGKVAIVDDADFEWLNQWKWMYHYTGYAVRSTYDRLTKKKGNIRMHRTILSAPPDKDVDHIDGDGLNNQRHNLRLATPSQNLANHKRKKHNTSGYTGVSWDKKRQKWRAYIGIDGKWKYLGRFDSKLAAAKAYDQAAVAYFGPFAKLNLKIPPTQAATSDS